MPPPDHRADQWNGRGGQRTDGVEIIDGIAVLLKRVQKNVTDDSRPAMVEGDAGELAERLAFHFRGNQPSELFARLQHGEVIRLTRRCVGRNVVRAHSGSGRPGLAESLLFIHGSQDIVACRQVTAGNGHAYPRGCVFASLAGAESCWYSFGCSSVGFIRGWFPER